MREKITAASVELFDQKGYQETSIQDIVDSIGVTKGTFYYYFQSKEELLYQISYQYIENLVTLQEEIINDAAATSTEKMRGIVHLLLLQILTERKSARIFIRETRNIKDSHLKKIKKMRDRFRFNYEETLREGKKVQEFDSTIDEEILTFAILGITNWSYYWYQPEGKVSLEELTDKYMNFILHGIKKRMETGDTL